MSQRPGTFFVIFAHGFCLFLWAVVFARACSSRCFLSQQSWKHRFCFAPWDSHNFSLQRNPYDIRSELAASILSVCPSLDLSDNRWLADLWYLSPCDRASISHVYTEAVYERRTAFLPSLQHKAVCWQAIGECLSIRKEEEAI